MAKAQAQFKQRLYKALSSQNLTIALNRALPNRRLARSNAFAAEQEDFSDLRDDLQRRKREAIDRLPELVAQFKEEAEKAGAQVHLAKTPSDALTIVADLAEKHGVKLVVKSKSMATEEIGLNEHLEERRIKVVETDLGEWIVQLAGEKPSHLITPALHKTREEIAELFSNYTGEEVPADIPKLVEVARKELRHFFIDADMGITGANVAIAETGTLVIVTNEGNGRLVSTLPPIHVAVLGMEKIMPTMEDATAVLKVLSKSGTGQKATTYVSFITGPSRTADIELSLTIGVHGPKEVHIILLDNGRTEMRDRPEFRDALDCIRCGACLNACPSFQAVGGHAFGYKYTGPIGLILTAFHHGHDHAEGPQSLCLSCNACETVCPAAIDIPRMILDLRQEINRGKPHGLVKGQALGALSYQPASSKLMNIARVAQKPFTRKGNFLNIPLIKGWKNLPALPDKSFLPAQGLGRHFEPTENGVESGAKGSSVLYFPACITDNLFPDMGDAAVKVLTGLGASVILPSRQQCCGLGHMNAGDGEGAITLAKQTIEMLEKEPGDYIVSTSASCVVAMVQDYPHLLRDEPEWQQSAEALSSRIKDFVTFIDEVAQLQPDALTAKDAQEVTYHDSCQSTNCLKLGPQQRRLLQDVMGITVAEMEESSMCCGFGGTFSLDYPKISERILRHKLDHIAETGAPTVTTDNSGCIMQLRSGLKAAGKDTRVLHLAELMAERLDALRRSS